MMALSLSLIKFLLTGKLDDDGKTLEIEVFGKLGWQVNLYVTEESKELLWAWRRNGAVAGMQPCN
jgi:hypothetical protein